MPAFTCCTVCHCDPGSPNSRRPMTSSIVSLVHPKMWPAIGPTIAEGRLGLLTGGLTGVALLLTVVGRAERLAGCPTGLLTLLDVGLPARAVRSYEPL